MKGIISGVIIMVAIIKQKISSATTIVSFTIATTV
jgi:hypothetical protein